jgi:hypothetical protein
MGQSFIGGIFGVDSFVVTGINVNISVLTDWGKKSYPCVQYTEYPRDVFAPYIGIPTDEYSCSPGVGIVRQLQYSLKAQGGFYLHGKVELVNY